MTTATDPAGAAVERVLALLRDRPASLGQGRLVCVDGRAGTGKTTLAEAIALQPGATVVHLDDLYGGWDGLNAVALQVEPMLRDLAAGHPGRYRRYDWVRGRRTETVVVDPTPLLVLEGVGAGSAAWADLTTVLVWLDASDDVRKRRALDRDGDDFAPHWDAWATAETAYLTRDDPRARADVVLRSL